MIVSVDFETHLIAPGRLAPPPVCMTWARASDSGILHAKLDADQVERTLAHWLTHDEIVGAKIAYDMGVMLARWPDLAPLIFRAYDEGRVLDVQLNQKLADLARGRLNGFEGTRKLTYSLSALEFRLLDRDRSGWKEGENIWRMRYAELEDVPIRDWPADAVTYAVDDAVGTLDVFNAQLAFAELWADDAQAQARAAFALHLETCRGIVTDQSRIDDLERTARARFEEVTAVLVREKLVRGTGVPKEGSRDTKAAKRRMVQACIDAGIDVKLTKTGAEKFGEEFAHPDEEIAQEYPACDAEACKRVDDPVLAMYAERVSLVTTLRTDVPDMRGGCFGVPIQPAYNTILETGRVSCRKDKLLHGVQIQNRKRDGAERGCFMARDLAPVWEGE